MNRKLNRELNYLLSTNHIPYDIMVFGTSFTKFKNEKINSTKEIVENKYYPKSFKQSQLNYIRIFELANKIGLNDDELLKRWKKITIERTQQTKSTKLKPTKEGRDNKGVYVGGGGYNKNMVRYPSKKRSKRVWKTFYKMFPYYAKLDGWDGVTSNKMK